MYTSEQKSAFRKAGIDARLALNRETALEFSLTISKKLLESRYYEDARAIFSYMAFKGEADVSYFNRQAALDGKTVAFPLCYAGGRMDAAVPLDENAWEPGRYGLIMPVAARSRIVPPEEIDLVILPCAAADIKQKMRVGMGAGYYDRYLPRCTRAVKLATVFEVQTFETGIAFDAWDAPLDGVVTEKGWFL